MQKTILIADFEQEPSEALRQILLSEGFLVLTASDGQQALAVFEAAKPDLVLTEALLPKLNGFELCKKIARGEALDVRPVIMYSAIYKGEKYQREAIDGCGAFEFLDKPIPKWQLLKSVRTAFSEASRATASASPVWRGWATAARLPKAPQLPTWETRWESIPCSKGWRRLFRGFRPSLPPALPCWRRPMSSLDSHSCLLLTVRRLMLH